MCRIVGHGIDLVEVNRIQRMIEEHGDHFIERTFAPGERLDDASLGRRAEHYAARFACKEAVVKALGTGFARGIALDEIEVRREPGGKPVVELSGRCAEIARKMGVTHWHIALTHSAGLAMASAIACEDENRSRNL